MIGAAHVDRMYNVIEHMLASGDGGRCDDIRHQIDAEISATIRERLENFVWLVARMRIDGGASRMRNQNRLLRLGDALGSSAISAMTQIDRDPKIVHLFDRGNTRLTQAGVARLEASVAE